ncbi:MAG TPA: UDP-glucuronic acid decarboxylase family protein [Nitrospiraceae bacterium]|nr:UDP-glucuronic acid decarboxylase family protein [Nitrospiraceae bacterium]
MRVLITGGAGFLGSHLCDRLIGMGHHVVCVDNLITGSMDNLAHLVGHERFSFVQYNVCDYLYVEGPLDAVMHFASPASPQDYLEFPIATLKVGALGTHKALGLAKAKNARFLLASTSEVYGDPQVSPQSEAYWGNVNPISPRGVYDEAKRFAEAMTMAYHRYHGVDTRIVRIFNTYGPRMRPHDGRVVSNFIVQALSGKPLTVFGTGSQTRSFCYVDDLVEGITRLLLVPSDRTPAQRTDRQSFLYKGESIGETMHEPINLGNPHELTVLEIAKKIQAMVGNHVQLEFKQLPADDPKVRCPDIRRAKELLGWEPKVGLDEGLERTIEYFRKKLG